MISELTSLDHNIIRQIKEEDQSGSEKYNAGTLLENVSKIILEEDNKEHSIIMEIDISHGDIAAACSK